MYYNSIAVLGFQEFYKIFTIRSKARPSQILHRAKGQVIKCQGFADTVPDPLSGNGKPETGTHDPVHFKIAEPEVVLLVHSNSHVRTQFGVQEQLQSLHTDGCWQAAKHCALCLPGGRLTQNLFSHWSAEPKQSPPKIVPTP